MTKKKLYAHIVLDRSGSMESCRDSTIGAVNEYVNGLAMEADMSARVSLTLFDTDHIDLIHDNLKAKEFPKLSRESFVPRGGTPLNDAIGKTVAAIDASTRREGESVVLVVVTDGFENASTEYTKDAVKALLDGRQKDKNWLVIYLGANQDAFAEGAARGTIAANTMSYNTSNTQAAMSAVTRRTMAFAASGSVAEGGFTDDERKKAS